MLSQLIYRLIFIFEKVMVFQNFHSILGLIFLNFIFCFFLNLSFCKKTLLWKYFHTLLLLSLMNAVQDKLSYLSFQFAKRITFLRIRFLYILIQHLLLRIYNNLLEINLFFQMFLLNSILMFFKIKLNNKFFYILKENKIFIHVLI